MLQVNKYERAMFEEHRPPPLMTIYLAGPMRGYDKFNAPAFDAAALKLRKLGIKVFSPAENDRDLYGDDIHEGQTGDLEKLKAETEFSARQAFLADTHFICTEADAIALLPGWEKSKGATAERALAIALGLTVIELGSEFLK